MLLVQYTNGGTHTSRAFLQEFERQEGTGRHLHKGRIKEQSEKIVDTEVSMGGIGMQLRS